MQMSIYANEKTASFFEKRMNGTSVSSRFKQVVEIITELENKVVEIFTPDDLYRLARLVDRRADLDFANELKKHDYEMDTMLRYKVQQFTAVELVLILDYARTHT